jgi:hypothetical protein
VSADPGILPVSDGPPAWTASQDVGGPTTARPSVVRALRTPLLPTLVVGILLIAGCTGGNDDRSGPGTTAASPNRTQASGDSNTAEVKVTASAAGNGDAATLQRASAAAIPELERFLSGYLAVAFAPSKAVDPGGDLAKLFDPPLRGRLANDVSALSLGPGGAHVSSVTITPATAKAALIVNSGKAQAATVRFSVDGDAVTEAGTTPISLRSTFQMLRGGTGWTIVAYDSEAKVPA